MLFVACSKDKKQDEVANEEPVEAEAEQAKPEQAEAVDEASQEVVATPSNPFANVTKWKVELTATTTMMVDITPEEAEQIEKGNYGKYEREFTELDAFVSDIGEGPYIAYHADVVEQTKTVTDPRFVKKLNEMMLDEKYSEYSMEVRVKGNTAYAHWYGGNRGGGVDEDFPSDVAKHLYE